MQGEESVFPPESVHQSGGNTFPARERLRSSKDFSRIFARGKIIRSSGLTVRWLPNLLPFSRMGVSVGRRFGNAVKRNRARRILKELYRTGKFLFPHGVDLVFMPGSNFLEATWLQHQKRFSQAAMKISYHISEAPGDTV